MSVVQLLCSLLTASLLVPVVTCQCEDSQWRVGLFSSCQVDTNNFFTDSPVLISAQQSGLAGLPDWLRVGQFNSSFGPAYIYGTPTEPEGAVPLEVRGLNEITFESRTREITITISPADGAIILEHELYITNFDVLEFLQSEVQTVFQSALSAAYPVATPSIVRVDHPSSRGIPAPLPPTKHGVIVVVSPGLAVQLTTPSCSSSFVQSFTHSGFQVEACTLTESIVATVSPPTPGVAGRDTPTSSGSRISLLVILIVGAIILLMVVSGLAVVFFGRRKEGVTVSGKKKLRQSTMHSVAKETSLGPVVAQSHLRDMARPPTVRPPTAVEPGNAGGQGNAGGRQQSVSGEALLEFQDLTDYNNRANSPRPLPPYVYPNISYIPFTRQTM
ncbi:uncharacterized protein LOC135333455 [Halichondria panicea]|uniref:uncharacterized protein LOC135333455 n=1 Tax=Halichondria panicea TaxID=6063 RepID=UPI00312BA081